MDRQITVISTRSQAKKTFTSHAETLGQLKEEMCQQGIDYDGMTFYEGVTKTELTEDGSQLPHDVEYKGQRTNDLVFMLSNANKQIASGN
jgi:hypothetical protein